jgi:nitrite reductase (NADH) large subunit
MRLVIIGNGVAGVTTARYVTDRDPSIETAIYSDESYPYYPRPRLIDLIAGHTSPEAISFYPQDWYTKRGIDLHLNRCAVALDPAGHRVTMAGGEVITYDLLLLANGAHAWVPPIRGADQDGVFTLRSMEDAIAIRERARTSSHVVVLGGGLLGLDLAHAIHAQQERVTVVELLPRLLPRQLDEEGAAVLQATIEQGGVHILTGKTCTLIEGENSVQRIHLASGEVIDADMVIISAGVRPNLELALSGGLTCGRGVVVDERLRTSHPDILAVGDVAEFHERVWGIIAAALAQARVAAAQIAGDTGVRYHDIVPSTTLKVTGIDVTSIGEAIPEANGAVTEVRRSKPDAGIYEKLVVRNGQVVGAIFVGDRSNVGPVTQLMSRKVDVTPYLDTILSTEFDIKSLL